MFRARTADGRWVAIRRALHGLPERIVRETALLRGIHTDPDAREWIVQLLDSGPGFQVLPWFEHSLASWLATEPDALARLRVLLDCATAIAHLHARGLVHRDVKPSNFMIDDRGRAVLGDLGGEDAAGTRGYAGPEQRLGLPLDAGADAHALSVMCFVAIAGTPPLAVLARPAHANLGPDDRLRFTNRLAELLPAAEAERISTILLPRIEAALHPDPSRRDGDVSHLAAALAEASRAPVPAPAIRRFGHGTLIFGLALCGGVSCFMLGERTLLDVGPLTVDACFDGPGLANADFSLTAPFYDAGGDGDLSVTLAGGIGVDRVFGYEDACPGTYGWHAVDWLENCGRFKRFGPRTDDRHLLRIERAGTFARYCIDDACYEDASFGLLPDRVCVAGGRVEGIRVVGR